MSNNAINNSQKNNYIGHKSRLREAFLKGKAIIPFITCGDPDLETTAATVRAAVENGADVIELGIPFSDPTAEGAVIQEANIRALQGGVTTDKIFAFVRELRKEIKVPFVFVTYANVVFSYGAERFISTCGEMGVDGLILPDLPFEEKGEFQPICRQNGVELISMIAPAPEKRITMIAREAEGFLYIVPGSGQTRGTLEAEAEIAAMTKIIRQNTDIPCVVGADGFTEEQVACVAQYTDGVIFDSVIVRLVEEHGRQAAGYVGEYVRDINSMNSYK